MGFWSIKSRDFPFLRSPFGASFESTSEKLKDLQPGEVLEMLEGPRKVPPKIDGIHGMLMGWELYMMMLDDVDGWWDLERYQKQMMR